MRVEPTAEIAGLPVLEVRRLLRETMNAYGWHGDMAKALLNLSSQRCAAVIRRLCDEGFIEPSPSYPGDWRNTTKGNALASASAAKPLHRQTALTKLGEFVDRVHFVNSPACEFLFWIEEVALFGSTLTEKDRVNDIDLCVRMERKLEGEAFVKAAGIRGKQARLNGKSFRSVLDELFWAEHEVHLYLKNRSRAVSLVEWNAEWLAVTAHKVIYRRSDIPQPTETN